MVSEPSRVDTRCATSGSLCAATHLQKLDCITTVRRATQRLENKAESKVQKRRFIWGGVICGRQRHSVSTFQRCHCHWCGEERGPCRQRHGRRALPAGEAARRGPKAAARPAPSQGEP